MSSIYRKNRKNTYYPTHRGDSRPARIRQLKKYRLFAIRTIVIAMLIITCFFCRNMYADQTHEELPVYKYYTSITVKSGDTLTSIAGEYLSSEYASVGEYIDEVKFINHLKDERIYAGDMIVVPYYSVLKK